MTQLVPSHGVPLLTTLLVTSCIFTLLPFKLCLASFKALEVLKALWDEEDELEGLRRRRRKKIKACSLPEFDEQIAGSRVTGDPARAAVRVINNIGWSAGLLHSTIAREDNFLFTSTEFVSSCAVV
ncbi:hypothetical protein F2P56_019210 [Juglans regia]|uniref:Uncharacterized protein LOC108987744 n=2 Tax=Juglans regia TaxID=51240 RepID=A0A2I4EA56_JUGRE|nr:uncharacterized protein LOC108987744 [Juglans regia]KAF5463287.1 hypothetical protein F2P56_019210 [Juglans regia]